MYQPTTALPAKLRQHGKQRRNSTIFGSVKRTEARSAHNVRAPIARALVALITVTLLVSSCTVTQNVVIDSTGSGEGTLTLELEPIVLEYIRSIQEGIAGAEESGSVFAEPAIRAAFSAREGIDLAGLDSPDERTLILDFEIEDLNTIESDFPGLIDFSIVESTDGNSSDTESERRAELSIQINRDTFTGLSGLFIDRGSPAAVFVPTTEADFFPPGEYKELAIYALEDYATPRKIGRLVENAVVRLEIRVDGTIIRGNGPKKTFERDTAIFEIPLLDIVTLVDPISINVVWR